MLVIHAHVHTLILVYVFLTLSSPSRKDRSLF
uniref:Uncharacterized protein n=1 Tax=Anguilla anguilla TaxID=7936 RepID=A0A0E9S0A9_ANGAN